MILVRAPVRVGVANHREAHHLLLIDFAQVVVVSEHPLSELGVMLQLDFGVHHNQAGLMSLQSDLGNQVGTTASTRNRRMELA